MLVIFVELCDVFQGGDFGHRNRLQDEVSSREYVRFERTRVTMKIKGDNMWFAWCEHSWSIFPSVSSGMSKIGKGLGKNYCIANMHLDYGS